MLETLQNYLLLKLSNTSQRRNKVTKNSCKLYSIQPGSDSVIVATPETAELAKKLVILLHLLQ